MESKFNTRKVTFDVLQQRLITFINTCIQNGDFTERGLAKILGTSQPQIHNVLKGARRLRPELADRVIRKFEMSVLDLLDSSEIYEEILSRGRITVSSEPTDFKVAEHVAPRGFEPDKLPKKKPGRHEPSQLTERSSKTR